MDTKPPLHICILLRAKILKFLDYIIDCNQAAASMFLVIYDLIRKDCTKVFSLNVRDNLAVI